MTHPSHHRRYQIKDEPPVCGRCGGKRRRMAKAEYPVEEEVQIFEGRKSHRIKFGPVCLGCLTQKEAIEEGLKVVT